MICFTFYVQCERCDQCFGEKWGIVSWYSDAKSAAKAANADGWREVGCGKWLCPKCQSKRIRKSSK